VAAEPGRLLWETRSEAILSCTAAPEPLGRPGLDGPIVGLRLHVAVLVVPTPASAAGWL
jgi:hypothetical protein